MWHTLTNDYPPNPGGVARYAFRTAQRYGMKVVQPTWPRVPGGWLTIVWTIWRTPSDGWLTHQVLPLGVACWIASWLKRVPYVVVLHGMDFTLAFRNPWKAWLTRRVLRGAEAVVANTYALAGELREKAGVEPIVVYPMPSIIGNGRRERRTRNEERPLVFLSVARFVERKGMQRVLGILARHPEWSQKMRYRMVGIGTYAQTLRDLIAQWHLESWVELEEVSDDRAIHQAYTQADVFILPTITRPYDREGFGIVYLEAASFGLPSIASDIPGVDEAVLQEKTGVLVQNDVALEQAIEHMLCDTDWRERLGDEAYKHASSISESAVYAPLDTFIPPLGLQIAEQELPKVSVVIPLYNHARTLESCVQSVLSQKGVEVDICIVDDGSTDEGGVLADRLASAHTQIRVIHQKNQGAPVARNAGIACAKGEFLLCLDADTCLRSGVLERWVLALRRHPRAGYVYSDFRFGGKRFHTGAFSLARLRTRNFIHTSALVRASVGLSFDSTVKRFQDWDTWLTLAERGIEGVYDAHGIGMDVAVDRPGYSFWLPSFAYKFPWRFIPGIAKRVHAYEAAREIIIRKHGL